MTKRLTAWLICLTLLLTVTGCGFVNGEYQVIEEHVSGKAETDDEEVPSFEVENEENIMNALRELVYAGETRGILRLSNYDGNINMLMTSSCEKMCSTDPLGSYAVSYINNTVNRIISYYEIELDIVYRKSLTAINSIQTAENVQSLEQLLLQYMRNYESVLTVRSDLPELSLESLQNMARNLYYANPGSLIYPPNLNVTYYPENKGDRLVEIVFSYPYSYSSLSGREQAVRNALNRAIEAVKDETTVGKKLLKMCQNLRTSVSFVTAKEESSKIQTDIDTIYSVLMEHRGSSLGIALTFKALCDEANVDCRVVSGFTENQTHFWNIVYLEDGYYHIDISASSESENWTALLKSDEAMQANYRWNVDDYPVCDGSLTIYDILGYGPIN